MFRRPSAWLGAAGLLLAACGWEELDALAPLPIGEGGGPGDGGRLGDGGESDATGDDAAADVALEDSVFPPYNPNAAACNSLIAPVRQWTFDSDALNWTLATNSGIVGALSWTGNAGYPLPGALQVAISSTTPDGGYSNGAWAEFDSMPFANLSGRTVSAWLWLDSGPSPDIKLFLQTGSQYTWADNGTFRLTPHTWTCVSMSASSPSYENGPNYDPGNVNRVGFELVGASPFRVFIDTVRYY